MSNNDSFEQKYQQFKKNFFGRDPKIWKIYRDPIIKEILDFRFNHLQVENTESNNSFANDISQKLSKQQNIPQEISSIEDQAKNDILQSVASLSKSWENPASVENVIAAPSDPAIYGSFIGLIANSNMVHKEYSGITEELEATIVRMIANLVGYSTNNTSGFFTQGGTFCNLYGYLLGIRKSLPQARTFGMGYTHDYRMMNSEGGHYSNITNLSLLGINIRDKTIRIRVNEDNNIDLRDFELQLESCFRLHCIVPTIMLTMGTTDTFGVDDIESVYKIREKLCKKFAIKIKPHIHVDSAVGWPMIFFLNYDFAKNPLHINQVTIDGLKKNYQKFKNLKYADSFTIDFHKWGYVPYTSSLVMIKNKDDLDNLKNDPENFQYFEKEAQGHNHLHSTIECSRSAVGIFGAYANLTYFGIEGYQLILAHCLQNANYFRALLKKLPYVKVIADKNQGPSVGFRIYDPQIVKNANKEFDLEYNKKNKDEYLALLKRNTKFHRNIFLKRGKKGLYTNWVGAISHTAFDEFNHYAMIPGEKAVFMNPYTSHKEIDLFISNLIPDV